MAGNPSTLYSDAVAFLDDVWSEERGLFPYSTAVIGGSYVDDFRLQGSIRYTINSLLGLRRASQPTQDKVDRFLERQYASIESNADFGLLLALLDDQLDRPEAQDALRRVEAVIAAGAPRSSMQELGWMLWGLSAVANAGGSTRASAERLFERIRARSVHPKTGLPRHDLSLARRDIVSFGAIVYFLRGIHEYGTAFGDDRSEELFVNGVHRIVSRQGELGEWPWLYSVRSGRPVERYPVFAVHQDSMAPLFLLPALDRGLSGTRDALARSVAWVNGSNELKEAMSVGGPFRAYRSIERSEPFPRELRYGRALVNTVLGRASGKAARGRVRINPECRSYHLGWILFAWGGRESLFSELLTGGADDGPAAARASAA